MKILIVSGGNVDTDFALDFLKNYKYDQLIAVDKGAQFCWENDLAPALLTGDFDTLSPDILLEYEQREIPIRRFRPQKDAADIEIALQEAAARIRAKGGSDDEILILGGTGSRLDHMLGTIYSMAGLGPDIRCLLVDPYNRMRLLWPGSFHLRREACFGPYLSLLPIGQEVTGLTLRGMKYPLERAVMTCTNSLGVSNEIVEEEAVISFQSGLLACFESGDQPHLP